jgi:hypothetical protein
MPDLQTFMGLASSLKLAGEMAKAMLDIRDGAKLQATVIELQGLIMSAQGSALTAQNDQFALLETVRQLQERIATLEGWEGEKRRYALKDYGEGTFAYELKADESRDEPIHRLCPTCFNQGSKSILHYSGKFGEGSQDGYRCVPCKHEYYFRVRPRQSRSRSGGGSDNSWMAR